MFGQRVRQPPLLEQRVVAVELHHLAQVGDHLRLLEIAGNRWRQQIVGDLRKVMKLNRHHSLFKSGRLQESLAEHRALVQALQARDGAAAGRLMRAHFENGLAAATV